MTTPKLTREEVERFDWPQFMNAKARVLALLEDRDRLLEACVTALAVLSYADPPNVKTEAMLRAAIAESRRA